MRTLPSASREIVQGLVLVGLIGYLLSIILAFRSYRTSAAGAAESEWVTSNLVGHNVGPGIGELETTHAVPLNAGQIRATAPATVETPKIVGVGAGFTLENSADTNDSPCVTPTKDPRPGAGCSVPRRQV